MARWRRRRTRNDPSAARDLGNAARQRTEIVGVSIDPRHDLASGGTGLFEFWTSEGVPVRLHDMDLISIELRPVDRILVLTFEYTERQWTPAEAAATPVVVMRFEGVTIREWEDDGAQDGDEEPPAEAYGQVEDFEYDDGKIFRLTTFAFGIEFSASRLTIAPRRRR